MQSMKNKMKRFVFETEDTKQPDGVYMDSNGICKEYLMRENSEGRLPILFTKLGRWWGSNPVTRQQEEIDLIAQDGRVIVFIEVKMRTGSASYGREAVTSAKQKRICKGALLYMAKNNLTERQARFDVIEIRGAKLTHIKDAFPYRGPMF